MNWLMQFFASPLRSLLGLLALVAGGIVLLLAIEHSPRGAMLVGGILVSVPLLIAVRVPVRLVLTLAGIAFVIVGVLSLIGELMASGVLTVLLLICGLLVLIFAWRRVSTAGRSHGSYSHGWGHRRGSSGFPRWLRRSFRRHAGGWYP